MNYKGLYHYTTLNHCRVCGMDAAERMVTETLPERWYVVCQVCGFKTHGHPSKSAASREWNGGQRKE